MRTDSVGVLEHGMELGARTWAALLEAAGWRPGDVEAMVCHQVGGGHAAAIRAATGVPEERDFTTYRHLGNVGTVSLPLTAALAEEAGVLVAGRRTALLGIGSGLNCLMLAAEW
jgi:3-oxoacyl-[acyl-carrier-protein] synthase-3